MTIKFLVDWKLTPIFLVRKTRNWGSDLVRYSTFASLLITERNRKGTGNGARGVSAEISRE